MSAQGERSWISEKLEDLRFRLLEQEDGYRLDPQGLHCDVLIVGSGYGGSVSAAALGAVRGEKRVWLLERGDAYLPGDFPNQLSDLPRHVRFNTARHLDTRGTRRGLFDVRVSEDVSMLVANGLGGGSLINAGVMAWPEEAVFRQSPWPLEIVDDMDALQKIALDLKRRLGAANPDGEQLQDNTIALQDRPLRKHEAMRRLSRGQTGMQTSFQSTPITVAMRDQASSADVALKACNRCGDCATGCNQGAKISLDTTLLAQAYKQGVKLITGATVLHLSRRTSEGGGWIVHVQHTDPQMQWQHGQALELHAARVILSAGTMGSTGILLRTQAHAELAAPGGNKPRLFSNRLGERFSANGDLVLSAFNQNQEAGAIASETQAEALRDVGPTITGMISCKPRGSVQAQDALHRHYVVQDLAVPAAMARFFAELNTTSSTLHQLGRLDTSTHDASRDQLDPLAVDPDALQRTLPLAIIGHDSAQGSISLAQAPSLHDKRPNSTPHLDSDGAVTVSWPDLRHDARFDTQIDDLAALCRASGTGGTVMPNPGWRPVPQEMSFLVEGKRGPLFTAHPLGGCAMGSTSRDGVVNHLGQVFKASHDARTPSTTDSDTDVHDDLAVLDGAIIPTSLGINPSLTIATLSERAVMQLGAAWGFTDTPVDTLSLPARPTVPPLPLPPPDPTCIEITEQLRGWIGEHGIEITLRFKEVAVPTLLSATPIQRTLEVDARHSTLRVVDRQGMPEHRAWDEAPTVLQASLSGRMHALHRAPSCAPERIVKAGAAWLLNRGLRDITQHVLQGLTGMTPPDLLSPTNLQWLHNAAALASRGGEVRLLAYELVIDKVESCLMAGVSAQQLVGRAIQGHKRVTYARRGNPWEQLMTLTLTAMPVPHWPSHSAPTLKLNLAYFARIGVPLLRITRQRDMPTALADLASLAMLFLRLFLSIHVWSMRAVDPGPPREARRLPDFVPGLPPPVITELDVGPPLADGTPVRARLTRYPNAQPGRLPLVMLHGYSASGTTFAHHAVQPGLAKYMWDQGYDVWLLDMRTSAGMPSATHYWSFEDVALNDIPLALSHVADHCRTQQVDVFAHCMGSAMLWIGLLMPMKVANANQSLSTAAYTALQRLRISAQQPSKSLIRRLAMSQIAPLMVFKESNLFRAFLMRYLRHYLPIGPYRFKPDPQDSDTNALLDSIMQRLLATLPYPQEEFDIENPLQPWKTAPWARTRRRMDALYGRDFNLQHIDPPLLDFIDDHFGPLSLDTLSQVIHLARNRAVSNVEGFNNYLTQPQLAQAMDGLDAMMSVHGVDNGLSDIQGLHAFERYVADLGPAYAAKYTTHAIPGRGHQDCLIGRDADRLVFPHVAAFFNEAQR